MDVEATLKKLQRELNSGTVSLVLLSLLGRAAEPLYGYQIAKRLDGIAPDGTTVKHGTLYPVLRSLEAQGLVRSTVEPSVSGPPRRYYEISRPGREALTSWKVAWTRTRDLVDSVLEGKSDE